MTPNTHIYLEMSPKKMPVTEDIIHTLNPDNTEKDRRAFKRNLMPGSYSTGGVQRNEELHKIFKDEEITSLVSGRQPYSREYKESHTALTNVEYQLDGFRPEEVLRSKRVCAYSSLYSIMNECMYPYTPSESEGTLSLGPRNNKNVSENNNRYELLNLMSREILLTPGFLRKLAIFLRLLAGPGKEGFQYGLELFLSYAALKTNLAQLPSIVTHIPYQFTMGGKSGDVGVMRGSALTTNAYDSLNPFGYRGQNSRSIYPNHNELNGEIYLEDADRIIDPDVMSWLHNPIEYTKIGVDVKSRRGSSYLNRSATIPVTEELEQLNSIYNAIAIAPELASEIYKDITWRISQENKAEVIRSCSFEEAIGNIGETRSGTLIRIAYLLKSLPYIKSVDELEALIRKPGFLLPARRFSHTWQSVISEYIRLWSQEAKTIFYGSPDINKYGDCIKVRGEVSGIDVPPPYYCYRDFIDAAGQSHTPSMYRPLTSVLGWLAASVTLSRSRYSSLYMANIVKSIDALRLSHPSDNAVFADFWGRIIGNEKLRKLIEVHRLTTVRNDRVNPHPMYASVATDAKSMWEEDKGGGKQVLEYIDNEFTPKYEKLVDESTEHTLSALWLLGIGSETTFAVQERKIRDLLYIANPGEIDAWVETTMCDLLPEMWMPERMSKEKDYRFWTAKGVRNAVNNIEEVPGYRWLLYWGYGEEDIQRLRLFLVWLNSVKRCQPGNSGYTDTVRMCRASAAERALINLGSFRLLGRGYSTTKPGMISDLPWTLRNEAAILGGVAGVGEDAIDEVLREAETKLGGDIKLFSPLQGTPAVKFCEDIPNADYPCVNKVISYLIGFWKENEGMTDKDLVTQLRSTKSFGELSLHKLYTGEGQRKQGETKRDRRRKNREKMTVIAARRKAGNTVYCYKESGTNRTLTEVPGVHVWDPDKYPINGADRLSNREIVVYRKLLLPFIKASNWYFFRTTDLRRSDLIRVASVVNVGLLWSESTNEFVGCVFASSGYNCTADKNKLILQRQGSMVGEPGTNGFTSVVTNTINTVEVVLHGWTKDI